MRGEDRRGEERGGEEYNEDADGCILGLRSESTKISRPVRDISCRSVIMTCDIFCASRQNCTLSDVHRKSASYVP